MKQFAGTGEVTTTEFVEFFGTAPDQAAAEASFRAMYPNGDLRIDDLYEVEPEAVA